VILSSEAEVFIWPIGPAEAQLVLRHPTKSWVSDTVI
jgi:hypothetical protein